MAVECDEPGQQGHVCTNNAAYDAGRFGMTSCNDDFDAATLEFLVKWQDCNMDESSLKSDIRPHDRCGVSPVERVPFISTLPFAPHDPAWS